MSVIPFNKDKRRGSIYLDQRSGEDRRKVYNLGYFAKGGIEKRGEWERRKTGERRKGYVRATKWSSIYAEASLKKSDD